MKFGVEVTGIPPEPFDAYGGFSSRVRHLVCDEFHRLGYEKAYIDGHCLEVPSPIFLSIERYGDWYRSLRDVMTMYRLSPHHPDVVCGGGHIHVEVLSDRKANAIIADLQGRYYLPWVFSQSDEEESCDNVAIDHPGNFFKGQSVYRSGYRTVEFRFFEAPLTWSEQKDQLDFVEAYMKWARKNVKLSTKHTLITFKELNAISMYDAVTMFRKMCGEIGVEANRYEKYIRRNLEPRWGEGYVRR
jgi:hypothetical protein